MMKFLSIVVLFILTGFFSQLKAQAALANISSLDLKETTLAIKSIENFRQSTSVKPDEVSAAFPVSFNNEQALAKFVLFHLLQNASTATAITNGYNDFVSKSNSSASEEQEAALETIIKVLSN
jgi:hypothetical protein